MKNMCSPNVYGWCKICGCPSWECSTKELGLQDISSGVLKKISGLRCEARLGPTSLKLEKVPPRHPHPEGSCTVGKQRCGRLPRTFKVSFPWCFLVSTDLRPPGVIAKLPSVCTRSVLSSTCPGSCPAPNREWVVLSPGYREGNPGSEKLRDLSGETVSMVA